MASGAGQSAVVTSLLDHGADVHTVTGVGDCSTALGVCTLVLWLSSFLNILTLNFWTFKRCRVPPFLSTPFILHSVTTSRTSNTHQLVVGMTVHEILDMVAYVHMYAW